jgi:hypothetical protein
MFIVHVVCASALEAEKMAQTATASGYAINFLILGLRRNRAGMGTSLNLICEHGSGNPFRESSTRRKGILALGEVQKLSIDRTWLPLRDGRIVGQSVS